MPPFSRGASRILFQPRMRAASSFNKRPSPLSKSTRKLLPSSRPTKIELPPSPLPKIPSTLPKTPSKNPIRETKFTKLDRLNPAYYFALLRLSLAQFSKSVLHLLRNQYNRLPSAARSTISFVTLLGTAFALIVPPGIIFRSHFYDIIRVNGPSMSPYLNADFEDGGAGVHEVGKNTDRILLKLYRAHGDLQRGMVIAFRTPHDPEKWAIKRIVAMQGDRVFPLSHYPRIEKLNGGGLVVPFGHIWVEGDVSDANKKVASMDSNIYGPVSIGLVVGKATHVLPSFFSRWSTIDCKHFKLPERVQINAVTLQDPDEEHQSHEFEEMFQTGKAAEFLQLLRRKSQEEGFFEKYRQNPDLVDMFHVVRTQAQAQLLKRDRQNTELATSLLDIVNEILGEG